MVYETEEFKQEEAKELSAQEYASNIQNEENEIDQILQ